MNVRALCRIVSSASTLEEGLHLIQKDAPVSGLVLPEPPSNDEKFSYLDTRRSFLITLALLASAPLVVGLWLFSSVEPAYIPVAVLLTAYIGVSFLAIGIWGRDMNLDEHDRIVAEGETFSPTVDIYLPCCGEPLEILNNTYSHVSQLRWFGGRLKVHVLDDGNQPCSVKALADEYGFNYIRRPEPGKDKKAGNLRHAFSITDGDFYVIFDADFVPRNDFLYEVIPYFKRFPDVAIVQTPQFFRVRKEQTWVERGAGSIQELFYRLVQQNRQAFDSAICVGSCAAYRRVALEPFGGNYLIGYSEDVHTSWQITDAGWKLRYVPMPLSMGTCPDEKLAFFNQNYRWCTGSTLLTTSRKFWTSRLTIQQKICYFSGALYYAATALSIVVNALPSILLIAFRPGLIMWYNTLFAIPSLLFPIVIMRVWNRQHYGFECIRIRWLQYAAHLMAIRDRCTGTMLAWTPTGSAAASQSSSGRFRNALRFLLLFSVAQLIILYTGAAYRVAQGFYWLNIIPSLVLETFNTLICFQVFYK